MSVEVARFQEARYAMNRMLNIELARLEQGLPWLALSCRVALPLGCFAAVLPMLNWLAREGFTRSQASDIPISLLQSALPLALGLMISIFFYAMHFQISRMVNSRKKLYRYSVNQFVHAISLIDGVPVKEEGNHRPGLHLQDRYREVAPNCANFTRLNILQATMLFFFLIVLAVLFGPVGMNQAHMDIPKMQSGKLMPLFTTKPGLWINQDGQISLGDPVQGIRTPAQGTLGQAVAALYKQQPEEWLVVAVRNAPYHAVEDGVEVLRAAGVKKIIYYGH